MIGGLGRIAALGLVGLVGLGLTGAGALGCTAAPADRASAPASAAPPGPAATAPKTEPETEPDAELEQEIPMRVLVTGFNDWRDLGDPPNVWRCRDNPSCRLLVGEASDAAPERYAGPLIAKLEAGAPSIDWAFRTMPVTWGAFAEVPREYDVIVNVGLGVYDRVDALQLEAGAYNLRRGADAAAAEQPGPIAAELGAVLEAPSDSPIRARLAALAGRTVAGYEVLVAEAREDNSYLCNETHFNALSALRDPQRQGELDAVYFLHIPYAKDGDYEALADGVAGVILALLDR